MQKLLLITAMLLISSGTASAACSRISEPEIMNMSKGELDKLLSSYQKELRKEMKSTYKQLQSNRSYRNENQEVCQEEAAKIELFRVKTFGKYDRER